MISVSRRSFLATSAILPFVPLVPWAHAQTAGPATSPRRGGTLKLSVDQAPAVIHPLLTRVNPEHLVSELVYSSLTQLKADMSPQPDLAKSWTSNADLTEWTFKIRTGVRFHDGSPCTSEDVVATYNAILDPKTASPARAIISIIKEVVAVDDTTVLIRLNSPSVDLPVVVAFTNTRIIPKAIAKGDLSRLSREGIGTGPFKLVSYEPDRLVVVERNPDYFIPEQPYLDRVEIRVYPDNTAETSALIAGDNDLMVIVSQSEFGRLKDAQGIVGMQTPSGNFLNVNMGCNQKPFNDLRVRKALSLAVDREALVGFVAQDAGQPGNDVPLNSAYYFAKPQQLKHPDQAAARKLLAEAGYPDGIDLTLVASENPSTRTQLAVAIREMARPAGFRINVQTMSHTTYLEQVWKKGPFYIGAYNTQPTADQVFTLLYTSNAVWNETHWNNAEFNKYVVEARETADEPKRRELYGKAQDLMYEQVPSIIPLFFDLLAARRSYVQGFVHHPRGHVFRIERVWFDETALQRG